jgi:HEXXH motif-containing protein
MHFSVTDDLLEHIASEPADAAALNLLRKGRQSKDLQLAKYISGSNPDGPRVCAPAIHLLSRVQERERAIFDDLIGHPCFGSWAGYSARRLRGSVQSVVPLHVDIAYLNAIAVVAALRADLDADLTLYVRDRMVLLPTLGAVRVIASEFAPVQVTVTGGRVAMCVNGTNVDLPRDLGQAAGDWMPVRSLAAEAGGLTLKLVIEDLDYYRDSYKNKVTGRLSDDDIDRFADLLWPAWEILVRHVPQRAAELAPGLRSVVPLSTDDAGPGLSATSGTAYGALALTIPSKPEHLAATLVHEFQHSKLSALLDLVPLYDKAARDVYFAAWKPEPRPFGGLLQGSYAFLAVSEFWLRLFEAGDAPMAEMYFAELRLQVDNVVRTLEDEPHLNEAGRIFVAQMRRVLDKQLDVQVSPEVAQRAKRTLDETRHQWEQRRQQTSSR